MFPVSTVRAHAREKRARELVQRALLTLDNVFTESAAIESVGSFKIPAAIMEADEELFRTCDRSIIESARVRQAEIRSSRMSEDTVRQYISPDNPECERMIELAAVGMKNEVDPDFVSNYSMEGRPPLRRKAVRMASVF
jgi:hypothetical protein